MFIIQHPYMNVSHSLAGLLALFVLSSFGATTATQPSPQDRILTRSWVDHERYSGRPGSSPATPTDFRQLAYELQASRSTRTTASLSTTQRTPYDTVRPPRNNLGNRVPLSLIHWTRPLEVLTPEQQRQALSTGVTPEPALTNVTILAVAPVRPTTYRGASVEIALAAEDFFEETSPTNAILSLRIDAGDNSGWRALSIGQDINASYDSTGSKTVTVEATLSDGTILTASSTLDVAALSTPDPTYSTRLIAAYPYNNTTGTIYIYKSPETHAGLRCPVLVAEGFDMENNMDWDVLYNILNKEQLAETLRSYGRDLIVLDYTNAMRNIFENAALARAAVTYVNANRNNTNDKFTVIGASMGGLVTRIALADMDKSPATYGASHVNTWISLDSPHKGANIPLGIQEFLSFFYNKNSAFASAAELYFILNQPAAKQMLLVHHSASTSLAGNSSNTAFQASLDAKGYPTSCKKIAISNGSGYGEKQPFSEGDLIVYWYYGHTFLCDVSITAHVDALSTTWSPVPTVFYGFWDTLAWFDEASTTQQHYYFDSLDNAPGGTRDSFQVLFDSTASRRGTSDYCLWPNHCFIPTVSSLGISMVFCTYPLDYYKSIKSLSPFDEVHYAYWNEPHIDINANNKRWFMRAILESYDTDGDGFDDYQEYLIGTTYNSAASKLSGATIKPVYESPYFYLLWNMNTAQNLDYKVYFTENLAHEWTLVPNAYWYQYGYSPPTALFSMSVTSSNGFYKIVTVVKDPVTD